MSECVWECVWEGVSECVSEIRGLRGEWKVCGLLVVVVGVGLSCGRRYKSRFVKNLCK